ncbi:MAG: Killer protein [Methylophilaceae bacterium]|nr:Killer protein [Methylophilaceae bacterium]
MIKCFHHKGLELFFTTGNKTGIKPHHAITLKTQLDAMHAAESIDDLNTPASWQLLQLTGDLSGFWSVNVSGNWRLIFRYIENHIELIDYLDYRLPKLQENAEHFISYPY